MESRGIVERAGGKRRLSPARWIPAFAAVAAAAAFFLCGCSKNSFSENDYAQAEEWLGRDSRQGSVPRKKPDGDRYRIAYVDIDPYPPSGEMFYYFIRQIADEGWITLKEELPFDPEDTDARKLVEYLDGQELGDYVEFPADACFYLSVDGEEACRSSLKGMVDRGEVDLIFCMGTWPGQFVKDMGITQVPVMVYFSVDPVGAGLSDSAEDSGQDNFWCHISDSVYFQQLKFYRDHFDFQNIGMAYYDESVAAMRAYRQVAAQEGFRISEEKVEKLTGTDETARNAYYRELKDIYEKMITEDQIDAFLLSTDMWKDEEEIPGLLSMFYDRGIPVFVQNGEYFVKEGALMMVTASDAKGQAPFVAETFGAILNGAVPRSLNQEFLASPYLSINLSAAEKMGYEVPAELLLSAENIFHGGEGTR